MTLDEVAHLAQTCTEKTPVVFVLGSGASCPHGLPGMGRLSSLIVDGLAAQIHDEERDAWEQFTAHVEVHHDLEKALVEVTIPQSLLEKIVEVTWRTVAEDDLNVYESVRAGNLKLPLTELIEFFCRVARPKIQIVTTNYDRVAEYAAEMASQQVWTGFSHGYLPTWAGCDMASNNGCTVTVLKVHGSLDWFQIKSQSFTIGVPLARSIPNGATPQIVTPGVSKYEMTHQEPFRSIISAADSALDKAGCFICIGYGFNDLHVHPRLLARVRDNKANLILATKSLTGSARSSILESAPALRRFLLIEEHENGSAIYHREALSGVLLARPDLWTISGLTSLLTGDFK